MPTTLSLSGNFFTRTLPAGIGQLKKLETMDISENNLSGSIPVHITGLRSLLRLSLSNNGLSGRVPSLNGLWQLNSLDLSRNQLYGNLPALLVHLRTLLLSHNILSGHISPISGLQNLRILDLSNNRFSGAISGGIHVLPNAVRVDVSANRFTMIEVTRVLGSEMQLQELHAHTNHLQGHLPVNLVSAKNLMTINLGQNLVTGTIPREYGAKLEGSWRTLFLDSNFLTGGLPPQFQRSGVRISGSLAHNCLSCPQSITLCHGGQRPASECVRQGGSYRYPQEAKKRAFHSERIILNKDTK
ncbi:Leucine-rich repeat receptor protein kinase MSP1 [Vitis vinifera]|uniref:Leucine-rich repeat receptor protein kinase MSP1 n=1 Tax=Vitis vinifera TaxID=29760 RepID=A0A438I5G9_VITVI|nr:Leucine-rich repeat receptor protein kinase MSP1 [Vitis vinifera]